MGNVTFFLFFWGWGCRQGQGIVIIIDAMHPAVVGKTFAVFKHH
jgi:hypothetical protein